MATFFPYAHLFDISSARHRDTHTQQARQTPGTSEVARVQGQLGHQKNDEYPV